jgi:hypothetical protein
MYKVFEVSIVELGLATDNMFIFIGEGSLI